MTPDNFTKWLQGFLDASADELSVEKLAVVREKLATVTEGNKPAPVVQCPRTTIFGDMGTQRTPITPIGWPQPTYHASNAGTIKADADSVKIEPCYMHQHGDTGKWPLLDLVDKPE